MPIPTNGQQPTAQQSQPAQTPQQPQEVKADGGILGAAALAALAGAAKGHAQQSQESEASGNPWEVVDRYPAPSDFAHGDPALEGLQKLAQVPPHILQLAEKYPTAAKLVHSATVKIQSDKAASKGSANPTSHFFHAATWQQQHPGQDVNEAIDAAQAQGYEIQ